jgi:hypothetical protein
MGKDFLSYALLVAAAVVAYTAIADYLDRTMDNNFTTSTVIQVNKTAEKEIGWEWVDYSIGVVEE